MKSSQRCFLLYAVNPDTWVTLNAYDGFVFYNVYR